MALPEYSNEAINVLRVFHRVTWMVYVEGHDDVSFWRMLIDRIVGVSVEVEDVGGRMELEKYAERVRRNEIEVIVAMDSDYERVCGKELRHPRIMYTCGYAIENTIYSSEAIAKICQICCRRAKKDIPMSRAWLIGLAEKFRGLIKYEVASWHLGRNVRILGDNCEPYMASRKSSVPSDKLIKERENDLERLFTKEEMEEIESFLTPYRDNILPLLKGHFLSSAVRKFILNEMKRERGSGNLSHDALFQNGILAFEISLNSHTELQFYRQQMELAFYGGK